METVFLRNRKLQDLQTSLQICNKICTDRDRAGFAQLCRIAIIIVVSQRREGRVAHWAASLQICNKICTDRQTQAFAQLCRIAIILAILQCKIAHREGWGEEYTGRQEGGVCNVWLQKICAFLTGWSRCGELL